MDLYRNRAHHLLDCLTDEELESVWSELETMYFDLYILRAIQEAKRAHQPGDTLTREEAMRLLPLLQAAPRTL